jgi:membrane-associated phospholipid phosphatase
MGRDLLKITAWSALGTAIVITLLFLFADRPVDLAAHTLKGSFWYQAGKIVSLAANHHLYSILLLIGLVLAGAIALARGLSPWVRSLLFVCLAVVLAMFAGDFLKWLFGRYRPSELFGKHLYGFSFFTYEYLQHSFPSGHTLRIFSAMTALSLVWPRARIFWLAVAVLVGISRVVVTKHFPSDVVAGAFIGIFCALWAWRIMGPRKT